MEPSQEIREIEVTPKMLQAGMMTLSENGLTEEWPYVLESVYRAMTYVARAAASETRVSI